MKTKKHKTTHEENLDRLSRIEGQVRGVKRMIEEGDYCVDIITQIQAVTSALQSVGRTILHKHIEHCVADAVKSKSKKEIDAKIEEIMGILSRGKGRCI